MPEYSVLIVDDDIWMQRILSKTLQSYGFAKTYLAGDGYDGIRIAIENIPHLIILDILMPDLTGHQTLKILKTIEYTKHIPVLMVSALSDTENLGLAVKSGTAGFISKPFTRATVFEKLINIFGKENLDLIVKGQEIEWNRPRYSKPVLEQNENLSQRNRKIDNIEQSISNLKQNLPDNLKNKPNITSDQLKTHYQDDEKKSIESIKKLLMKSKK